MNTLLSAILIALIKTPGEGGIMQHDFESKAICDEAGEEIEATFTEMDAGNGINPKVLWACIELGEDEE